MEAFLYFVEHTDNGLELIIGTVCFLVIVIVPVAVFVFVVYAMIKSGKKNIETFNNKFDEKNKK